MPNRGHRAIKGIPDAVRRSARPTPLPLGAEVEPRRARALITLVRPTPAPLGAEMPADRACAIGREWMTKTGRTTPPSRTATLCRIRGTCKARNADSERSAQNQTLQHRCSSHLSFSNEKRAAYVVNPTERHLNAASARYAASACAAQMRESVMAITARFAETSSAVAGPLPRGPNQDAV